MINMIESVYFFDTYAMIEILKGNENYREYTHQRAVLTKLNLFEVFYNVFGDLGEETAEKIFEQYSPSAVDYSNNVIKEAAKFRFGRRSRNFSMTDCIGYIISKKLKIKFLTGDKEFQDMENVEFVK